MRGKKAKALRVDRTAEREAARRKQRQQTLFTVIVIAIIVGIGGVLVFVSMDRPTDDLAANPSESPSDLATEASEAASEGRDNRPVACGAEAPASAGEEKATFEEPEQVLEEGTDYGAVITTSCGRIPVDLFEDEAPETVNSFVFLAQQGFFDGLEIFRNATSIGALQAGSGTNDASWNVGYTIEDELGKAQEDGYPVGALAMANAGPNSAGSQFFFVYNETFDAAFADNRAYAVFGMANEKGQEVLAEIGAIPVETPDDPTSPGAERPTQITYIESVEITTE